MGSEPLDIVGRSGSEGRSGREGRLGRLGNPNADAACAPTSRAAHTAAAVAATASVPFEGGRFGLVAGLWLWAGRNGFALAVRIKAGMTSRRI